MTDGIVIYRSAILPDDGFVHGFPERTGGVSTGPRASLNLGFRWGDERAAVEENRRRVAAHVGYDPAELVVTKHVHGTRVWHVDAEPPPSDDDVEGYDGLVSREPDRVLAAFAADCIPILFADPVARVVGACHAGWRGTVGAIAANIVARMVELGASPGAIRVALGPSIGACCFEVGPEVTAAFRDAFGDVPGMIVAGPNKEHVDLRVATRAVLERAGVAPAHIDDRPPCTRCSPDRFFSYRRDGQAGGVHMGFIGMRRGP